MRPCIGHWSARVAGKQSDAARAILLQHSSLGMQIGYLSSSILERRAPSLPVVLETTNDSTIVVIDAVTNVFLIPVRTIRYPNETESSMDQCRNEGKTRVFATSRRLICLNSVLNSSEILAHMAA